MSIATKLLVATGVLSICLVSFQPAQAITIDLGTSGTIAAGTEIVFKLASGTGAMPFTRPGGPASVDFLVDGEEGRITFTQPTTLNVFVRTGANGTGSVFSGAAIPVAYEFTNDGVVLANTDRAGDLGPMFGLTALPHGANQDEIVTPIAPADLAQGMFFEGINFDIDTIFDLRNTTVNAALVFNQNVEASPVPEPGTLAALSSLAVVGLCFGGRRRRNRR